MTFLKNNLYAGHQSAVYTLLRLNATTFLSAGSDRIIAQWDINRPEEGMMIANASDAIYSLCMLTDDRLLAGQGKGEIHVIDMVLRQEVRLLKLFDAAVFKILFDQKLSQLYVLSGNGIFTVLDSNNFNHLYTSKLSSGKLRSAAVHPTLPLAVIGCGEGDVCFFDTESLKITDRKQVHEPGFSVNALAFSPDGKYLLSGSRDARLNIFDIVNMKSVNRIPAHNFAIYEIAYCPSGEYFATASRDKTIKIWTSKFSVLQRLSKEDEGHVNSVNSLIWMNNTTIVSGGDDRAVIGWVVPKD